MAEAPKLNRRQILSAGVLVSSTVALDRAQGRSISGEMPWQPGEANKPQEFKPGPWQYFTPSEREFIDAAVSRLIPKDNLGPGAKEVGVTEFLDRQLAGPFGKAAHWYMHGPWKKGEKTQGYQSRLTPAELYRAAIKAIDGYCGGKFAGKNFAQLSSDQQDQVLKGLEKGDIKLKGADAKTFFKMFLQNTVEGFFSDPIYGGNRDMAGWKLIGFPGARYDNRPYVKKHGQKLNLPPVGIKGRPGWTPA
jgi:gluconate 2-dehydrogenase gamma chain